MSLPDLKPPKGWTAAQLGQFTGQRGETVNPANTPDQPYELYSVPSFETGKPEVALADSIRSSKQKVEPQSVLLCKINPRINRVWVVGEFTNHPKIASTEWIAFPRTADLLPQFLKYFLQQNVVRDFLAQNASGVGGSLMRVKASTLADFPFHYPKPREQQQIVAKLEELFSELDKGIENLRQARAQLTVYRQAVLKHAFEGKLIEGSIKFESKLLKSLIEGLGQGWSPKCDLNRDPQENEWAIIKTTAVQSMKYLDSEAKPLPAHLQPRPGIEIKAGDMLMTRKGPRARAGVTCYVRNTRSKLMVCDTVYRFRCRKTEVEAEYLELALNSPGVVSEIDNLKSGINDSGVSLTHEKLGGVLISVPDKAAQKAIVDAAQDQFSVIEQLESDISTSLQKAEALRQSILKKAFAGELVPQDPADEPAADLLARIRAERGRLAPKEVGRALRARRGPAPAQSCPAAEEVKKKPATRRSPSAKSVKSAVAPSNP